jgi:large subunit ribosomal protein L19e
MDLNQVKKLAKKVFKTGKTKIKIKKPEEAMQAMTREDVRELLKKEAIEKEKTKGTSKVRARKRKEQKKKGRQKGKGKRKGTIKARVNKKEKWMEKIRAQRKYLKEIKPKLKDDAYRKLYLMCKGGYFRSKAHLNLYIKEKKLWKNQ